jgi:hypothetical protein
LLLQLSNLLPEFILHKLLVPRSTTPQLLEHRLVLGLLSILVLPRLLSEVVLHALVLTRCF